MITEVLFIRSVTEIKRDKLVYRDRENQFREIDFLECRKNWVDHFNAQEFVTFDGKPAPKMTPEENNCVGERDWFAEKPYYVFFASPRIRFEIHPRKGLLDAFRKNWRQRYYKEFRRIENALIEAGMCTFDLG